MLKKRTFSALPPVNRPLWGDALALFGLSALLYAGLRLALDAPEVVKGPDISLSPEALPWYALLSLGRMLAAYALSLAFTLVYGRVAASSRRAERVMMPLLDVLQSVPILSFLPVVLLGLSAILPQGMAAELASVVLIFTSQAWNLTFGWYQSLTTIPQELREAGRVFRFNGWMRLTKLELPFAAISLIWNSMMSWAGGWFFLMAAEIFSVGPRDFRLPGLGSYLQRASSEGDVQAVTWGIGALVLVIVLLDQLVWRPLTVWAQRFKLESVEDQGISSWFYKLMRDSRLRQALSRAVWRPLAYRVDGWVQRRGTGSELGIRPHRGQGWLGSVLGGLIALPLLYGGSRALTMLSHVPWDQWVQVAWGFVATLSRVLAALVIALVWTVPAGIVIGTNPERARWLQSVVQVAASVPATALFPVVLLFLLGLPSGLNLAAVLLMLLGTQWYLLFNVIAGASAIPQDLKYTASLLQLTRAQRWRTLVLPAVFPYTLTGAITAMGGAWNASIVAEYAQFGGQTHQTLGLGALIAQAAASGDYALLLAGTLSMVAGVVLINRLVWRRLYRLAEERYRME